MEKKTLELPHIGITTIAQIHSLKLTTMVKTGQGQMPGSGFVSPSHINFQK